MAVQKWKPGPREKAFVRLLPSETLSAKLKYIPPRLNCVASSCGSLPPPPEFTMDIHSLLGRYGMCTYNSHCHNNFHVPHAPSYILIILINHAIASRCHFPVSTDFRALLYEIKGAPGKALRHWSLSKVLASSVFHIWNIFTPKLRMVPLFRPSRPIRSLL